MAVIGLGRYTLLSFLAAGAVIYHAFATREYFYSATVYLSTSKIAVAVLGNLLFASAMCAHKALIKVFFGSLRDLEVEMIRERLSSAVMESLLALTIFREEFGAFFVAMFATLVFVKVMHWLVQDRVDYVEVTPSVSFLQHLRLVSFMSTLLLVDILFLQYTVHGTIQSNGQSVMLLFAFEYVIQASNIIRYSLKYIMSVVDMSLEGRWESKSIYVFYLELVTDLLHLFVYCIFFLLVYSNYGLPLHLVRDLYSTFRNFRNRIVDFLRFRAVTARLDRFPDASAEDLQRSDGVCIICREEMSAVGANKKLGCGHVFHLHCLRSWLERQQNCPTCRASVFRRPEPTVAVGQPAVVVPAVPAAAPAAAVVPAQGAPAAPAAPAGAAPAAAAVPGGAPVAQQPLVHLPHAHAQDHGRQPMPPFHVPNMHQRVRLAAVPFAARPPGAVQPGQQPQQQQQQQQQQQPETLQQQDQGQAAGAGTGQAAGAGTGPAPALGAFPGFQLPPGVQLPPTFHLPAGVQPTPGFQSAAGAQPPPGIQMPLYATPPPPSAGFMMPSQHWIPFPPMPGYEGQLPPFMPVPFMVPSPPFAGGLPPGTSLESQVAALAASAAWAATAAVQAPPPGYVCMGPVPTVPTALTDGQGASSSAAGGPTAANLATQLEAAQQVLQQQLDRLQAQITRLRQSSPAKPSAAAPHAADAGQESIPPSSVPVQAVGTATGTEPEMAGTSGAASGTDVASLPAVSASADPEHAVSSSAAAGDAATQPALALSAGPAAPAASSSALSTGTEAQVPATSASVGQAPAAAGGVEASAPATSSVPEGKEEDGSDEQAEIRRRRLQRFAQAEQQ